MKRLVLMLMKQSPRTIYFVRNVFGTWLMVSLLLIVFFLQTYINNNSQLRLIFLQNDTSKLSYKILTLFYIVALSIPFLYVKLAKAIDKYLLAVLTEDYNLKRYGDYGQEHLRGRWGGKFLGYYMLGVSAFYGGNFSEALAYFENSAQSRQNKKTRSILKERMDSYSLQARYFLKKSGDSCDDLLAIYSQSSHPTILALMDVLVRQQPNDYFDTLSSKSRLDSLVIRFYRAINAQHKGDVSLAKDLFNQVSQETDELFIVRESKKYLAKL